MARCEHDALLFIDIRLRRKFRKFHSYLSFSLHIRTTQKYGEMNSTKMVAEIFSIQFSIRLHISEGVFGMLSYAHAWQRMVDMEYEIPIVIRQHELEHYIHLSLSLLCVLFVSVSVNVIRPTATDCAACLLSRIVYIQSHIPPIAASQNTSIYNSIRPYADWISLNLFSGLVWTIDVMASRNAHQSI